MKTSTLVTVALAGAALVYMSRRLSQPAGAPGMHGIDRPGSFDSDYDLRRSPLYQPGDREIRYC